MFIFKVRCLLLLALMPLCLYGDALIFSRAMQSSTIAELFIEQKAIRVKLEIGMGDIPAFRNILPDAIYEKIDNEPSQLSQRLKLFFREDFIIEANGEVLRGGVLQMEPRKRLKRDDITGEALPNQGEGEDILFTELIYPFEGSPTSLAITPPMRKGDVKASIGLMTYHMGLPIMDFRYLSRKEVIRLDWDDPWYSSFENKNLRRQYNEPISAFLYAEPYETRVEIIVRPKDIQHWHDLGIQGLTKLSVDIQPALKEKITAFLLTQMELTIDGETIVPQLQRINFLKRTLKSSVVIDPPEELDSLSATLGVIYSVPTESLPKEMTLTWNLFSPKMQVVRAAATDEAGPMPYKLSPDDNVLVWKNFLKNPTIPTIKTVQLPATSKLVRIPFGTILCLIFFIPFVRVLYCKIGKRAAVAGGIVMVICGVFIYPSFSFDISLPVKPELSDEVATEVVSSLLKNVYTSFDFRDESAIYDALDQSLVGGLLTDVYLQTKKSLELQSQGGARVKVKAVHLEKADFQSLSDGFRASCVWDVMGSVGHWGHIHQRVNRYEAELDIQPSEGQWKITKLEIIEEQRVK